MKVKKITEIINGYMYEDLIDQKILKVQNKLDGSMITFVKLPNGVIKAKSKMSFISPQAEMANNIFAKNINIRNLVTSSLECYDTCIFELVSPKNQIVLEYQNTQLILLQLRDENGVYVDSKTIGDLYDVEVSDEFIFTLDELLEKKENDIGIEGWVVTTPDGHYKIKTDWYMQLHGLVTEGTRENLLIKTILDKNIDDVISQLVPGEKKDFIVETTEKVNHKFNHMVMQFKELRRKYFHNFKENKQEFAIKHSKEEMFTGVIRTLDTSFRDVEQVAEEQVKKHILHITRKLELARNWIDKR